MTDHSHPLGVCALAVGPCEHVGDYCPHNHCGIDHDPVPSADIDPRDVRCVICGAPAEPVDPDELAEALEASYAARLAVADGQTSWLS